jgi:hypothetical protein
MKNSTLFLLWVAQRRGPQHARFWRDGVERFTAAMSGLFLATALQAAEKVFQSEESVPQALKRGHIVNGLSARVELVPFPDPSRTEFFRSLFSR